MGKERVQAFPPKVAVREHWVSREVQITAPACCKQVPVWVLVKQKPWQYCLQGHKTAEALMSPVRGTKLVRPLKKTPWLCFTKAALQLSFDSQAHSHTFTSANRTIHSREERKRKKKILDTFCPNRFVVKTRNPSDFHQMEDKLIVVYFYFL